MNKAGLFLMEQIIAAAVFALCSAVCIRISAGSYLLADEARDLKNALLLAENAAESYKAASVYSDGSENGTVFYYDEKLRSCGEGAAKYSVEFRRKETDAPASLHLSELSVHRLGRKELISFTVAAGGEWRE